MAGCGEYPQTVAVIHREEHESLGLVFSCMQGKIVGQKHLRQHQEQGERNSGMGKICRKRQNMTTRKIDRRIDTAELSTPY